MELTITKRDEVKSTDRSYELLSETGNKTDDGKVWGYVEYPSVKEVDTVVLKQELEDIDVSAVIKAVNGL